MSPNHALLLAATLAATTASCTSADGGYHAAAWSPDGKTLAIGTGRSLRIEDARTRELLRELDTGGTVHAVEFTRSGSQVLYAGKGNTFALEPIDGSGSALRHADVNPVVAFSTAISRDERTIVSVSAEHDLLVWRAPFHAPERTLEGGGYAWVFGLTPDAEWAFSVTPDGQVMRWNVDTGERDPFVQGHSGYVFATAMAPGGERFATGGSAEDGTVALWDTRAFRVERRIDFGTVVRAIAFSPDGRLLAVGGNRRTITLYDVETGDERGKLRLLPDWPSDLAFAPDGRRLLATFYSGRARIYSLP